MIKLLWSEIPTSNTLEFLKRSFLFVKIRSIQLGFLDWKQVGFLIKLSRPNEFHKNFKVFVLNCHVEIANQHKVYILTG